MSGETVDKVAVRPASAADRPTLVAFMAELQETERLAVDDRAPGPAMADAHLAYLETLAEDGGAVLLACIDGEAAGFAIVIAERCDDGDRHLLESERRYGVVTDLYVVPGRRRAGIATRLLEAARDHCRAAGLPSLSITALAGNIAALRAYRDAGFRAYEITLRQRL